jgi:hypothetical protein
MARHHMQRIAALAFLLGCRGTAARPHLGSRVAEAAPAPRPRLSIGERIPELGCFGIATSRSLVACVVGSEGHDMGATPHITLAFGSLSRDVEAPNAIAIVETDDTMFDLHERPLDDNTRHAIDAMLEGFVAWHPVATLEAPARGTVGDTEIVVTRLQTSPGGDNMPPDYSAKLEVHALGQVRVIDEIHAEPLQDYEVRVFETGAGVVIERTETKAEEGAYAKLVGGWVCQGASCTPIE